ncbi:hypothetical protein [Planctomicrobium sp. SH527]|uniref:hypothetical protein n=1 Tax=Planctomicrobium sp. SH527 TaxID=3448123 RepID=UPI003F5B5EB4
MQRLIGQVMTLLAGLSLGTALLHADDASKASASRTPVNNIGDRRELFVDDALIEQLKSAELKPHYPEAREVILTCDAPWEGNISAYYTFIQDDDRIRVYYRGSHFTGKIAHEVVCYAESKDGIHWIKPKLGIFEFNGSKQNNIVWLDPNWSSKKNDHVTHNFTPFKDLNPNCPANAKYKALAGEKSGLKAFQSPDGIHWTLVRPEPVLTDGYFDSQNLAFWDPNRKCYVSYFRDFRGPKKIRDIKVSTSDDFLNWSKVSYLKYNDVPEEQLYTNAIRTYFRAPHLYVGFPTRYQAKTEQVEPILMTSRDGLNFSRWSEPLIPITAPKDRDGNRSNYMAHGLIQVPGQDREISVFGTEAYYAGPGSRVRRFTFRTDGFVSVHSGDAGEMVTKPLQFSGKKLTLNYAVAKQGSLKVEIQDAKGAAIPGFTAADSVALTGDEIDGTVKWASGADVSSLAGQPIRLRFLLNKADLYSMKFNN